MQYNYYPNYLGQPLQDNLSQLRSYQPTDTRIWVQGEIGAKAYLVAQGSTVVLWDSESKTIYVKSGTSNGVPVMQKLKYTIEQEESKEEQPNMSNYVTKEYLDMKLKELEESKNVKQSNTNDATVHAVQTNV